MTDVGRPLSLVMLPVLTSAMQVLLSLPAASPAIQSAGVSGRVTDSMGQPIPGAAVTAVPAAGGAAVHSVSRADGTYEVDGLAEGAYFVDFELPGFDLTRRNRVRVIPQTTAHADAVLYVSSICECVDVTPKQPLRERAGQVLSASGQPLPHARLVSGHRPRSEFGYADDEGRFAIRVPLDGTVPLTVSESGFESATQQVSGTVAAPLVFRLVPADAASLPDTERLSRPCCLGGLFALGR